MFSRPRLAAHLSSTAFPLHEVAGIEGMEILLKGECDINGGIDSGAVSAELDLELGDKVTAHIVGRSVIEKPFSNARALKADAHISGLIVQYAPPMAITVSIRSDSTGTALYANEDGGQARLSARINAESRKLSGSLKLTGFPLEYIVGIFERKSKDYRGNLNGTSHSRGRLKNRNFPHRNRFWRIVFFSRESIAFPDRGVFPAKKACCASMVSR